MSSIGPSLPPHLAKRKRDDGESSEPSSSSPPPKNDRDSRSGTPDAAEKRRRVMGPAPPPAPLDELPPSAPAEVTADGDSDDDSDSSSDDGFGPAPPTAADAARAETRATDDEWKAVRPPADDDDDEDKPKKTQRDEWMMVPPKQDDLAARMDPTKLRARGFQTGKGAKAPNHGGSDMGAWTETPEQKRKRLEDEVMGRAAPGGAGASGSGERDVRKKVDEETAARVRRYEEKRRGESLYEKHREKVGVEKDDDPSKRAFDYTKDMGGGMRIDGSKRKEMIRKAGDFGSKFSGGKFL